MSENDNVAPVDAGEADETADAIRPASARSAVDGAEGEVAGDAGAGAEEAAAEPDAPAAEGEGEPASGSRPPSARPASARPESARPGSARPASARPPSARPESARPESARPDSARPPSASPDAARPPSARPESARPESARPESARPASARPGSARPGSARPPSAGSAAAAAPADADAPAAEEAAPAPAEKSAPGTPASGSARGSARASKVGDEAGATATIVPAEGGEGAEAVEHHPDVITDINHPDAAEAHAEVDQMAQEQAREVIRSRQSSAVGERPKVSPSPSQKSATSAAAPAADAPAPAADAAEAERRASASNASVRSAGGDKAATPDKPSRQPAESMPMQSSASPAKAKSGPWLSGTYKLPKSGKIISGEELCNALERMTNAYIDKYSQGPNATKEIMPGAATIYNTKKLSPDEYDAMISRLYKPKDRNVQEHDRIQLVTLKFGEDGSEHWAPVKQVSAEDQQSYMVQLYQRCLDNRKKTQEQLAAKYLKPLGQPRKV